MEAVKRKPYTNPGSSGRHCAVKGCHNNEKKLYDLLQMPCFDHKPLIRRHCSCLKPFSFYAPRDPDDRREWLAKLQLKNPPSTLFVCSFHFIDKEPTTANRVPELYLGYETKVKKRRILNRCVSEVTSPTSTKRSRKTKVDKTVDSSDPSTAKSTSYLPVAQDTAGTRFEDGPSSADCAESKKSVALQSSGLPHVQTQSLEKSTQWEDCTLQDHSYIRTVVASRLTTMDQSVQTTVEEDVGVAVQLIKTNSDSRLYAGVQLEVFWAIVEVMQPFSQSNITMPVSDQILMTLMKLKLNLLYADLSRRFGVSEGFVCKVLSFWIRTLAEQLSSLIVWLPREKIQATMPECFKHYPKTTCIMDCSETIMQKSTNLKSRAESYSNYKSHNTAKYCVSIAPCGYIMHISNAYGGRCSDKFIVQDCGVLDKLQPGDEVMADRGFTIQDLLFARQVNLNIPAFSHGQQLSETEVTRTRRIASVRIHVERAIRKMKVFKILRDTIPINMTKKLMLF